MNRNLKVGVVLFLLVLCPLISYIYLKKGFEYQVDNFKELEVVKTLDSNISSIIFPFEAALNKINFVCIFSDTVGISDYIKIISKMNEQYKKVPNFFGFIYTKDSFGIAVQSMEKFQHIRLSKDDWDGIAQFFALPNTNIHGKIILIDVENNVRNHYDLSSESSIKKLIAHASLLFPKPKKRR